MNAFPAIKNEAKKRQALKDFVQLATSAAQYRIYRVIFAAFEEIAP